MNVNAILRSKGSDILSVGPDDTIAEAARLLALHRIGALLVMRDRQLAGIISERDIVRGIASKGNDCLDMPVRLLMTSDLVTCSPEDSVTHLMGLMTENRIRHLPVLRKGELVGMLSIGDVVKVRVKEVENEAQALRDYITAA